MADTLDTIYVRGPDEDKQKEHVGALGYQDKDNALACLYQTPLLENIVAWSEWHRVFEPMFGNLKSFLRNNSSDHNPIKINDKVYPRDLIAIETSTGSLLRITRITSTDVFSRCAERGDVIGTSGHLVSLVFQYGGVKKAPLALLASHMKEAFLSLNAQSKASEESTKYVIRFAVKCLLRVPPLMRHALAMKVMSEFLTSAHVGREIMRALMKIKQHQQQQQQQHQQSGNNSNNNNNNNNNNSNNNTSNNNTSNYNNNNNNTSNNDSNSGNNSHIHLKKIKNNFDVSSEGTFTSFTNFLMREGPSPKTSVKVLFNYNLFQAALKLIIAAYKF